ncbi:Uncharacterized protein L728 [Camellia lanceoleosa]|uniref:Uncharacterized protein L728 n=1 Tax=Camellia lanceoleosa TaxID=1840588 RepID=A0ACC0FSP4_9ERIC|nr:Uncharacterized protein L728 [Camellia lanceoleosa]
MLYTEPNLTIIAFMAPSLDLLGPPCLRRLPPPPAAGGLNQPPPPPQPIGQLQNLPPTLLPPKNPCLDFFFSDSLLPNLNHLLQEAWDHDPPTTLKIICSLRRARVVGKSSAATDNNDVFFAAVLWLHQQHPLTLACNVRVFASHGCLKDLLEILLRVLEKPKDQRTEEKREKRKERESALEVDENARALKKKNEIEKAKRAVKMYETDIAYRFLHDQIAKLFADLLKSDLQFLDSGETEKISLASKWCPSLDSFYDKSTLICEGIARKLFPRESEMEYKEIEEAHYAYRVRDRLQKQVLVPLRKALESAKRGSADSMRETQKRFVKKMHEKLFRAYQKNYFNLFSKDDNERFRAFLETAEECSGRRLRFLPHQIVASLDTELAERQWQRLVEDMAKKGDLKNCLAICNVSEGMRGTQMGFFSIAMGLLISELNDHPWKGKVLSFDTDPKLVNIEGGNLRSRIEFMKQMQCGSNIRFSKVFEQVLQVAVAERLTWDKMVRKIFVFTEMGFEKAANNFWGVWASFSIYQSRGYRALPEIVFWNLSDCVGNPGMKHKGVITVNGFSKNAVAMFLDRGVMPTLENVARNVAKSLQTPDDVMKSAISGEEFSDLFVLD